MPHYIPRKNRWTDGIYHPIQVLEHAETLHLEKFTCEDLDDLAGCTDIWQLVLRSDRADGPIDLARLAHITGLQVFWLERVQVKNLSALIALPGLRYLILEDCKIAPYDELACINMNWPHKLSLKYTAQSPREWIEECMAHYTVSAPAQALATTLIPIGTVSISDYECDDASAQREAHWQALLRTGMPDTRDVSVDDARQLTRKIAEGDWSRVHAVTDLPLWSKALSWLFNDHPSEVAVRGVLAHTAPDFFDEAVICGLNSWYTQDIKVVVKVFSELGERLLAPLQAGVTRYLKRWGHNYFDVDKLHVAHFVIADILKNVSAPEFAPLYLQLLNERHNFSQVHLRLYKALLDSVANTKSSVVVEPIIDLLRFEKHVIGGDAAFVKKIFKVVSRLGQYADAAVLANRFDVAAETRPDVIDAYETAIVRLRKKQNKLSAQ